jgi:dethiobiotin synthase
VLRGVFVTGTDTGVGKTVVCAALVRRYRADVASAGGRLRYWKPIQTGIERDDDTRVVRRLAGCADADLLDDGIRLRRPVSPHLAAQLSGTRIEIAPLLALAANQPADHRWVLEGAGGLLVPLNERALMVDLIAELALPLVVVARSKLGTINHTLLTLESARRRGLTVVGVVMVGTPNKANRSAIEKYGCTPVLGEMPRLRPVTSHRLAAWAATALDADGVVRKVLQ